MMLLGLSTPTLPLPSPSKRTPFFPHFTHNSHRLPTAPPPHCTGCFSKLQSESMLWGGSESPPRKLDRQCLLSKQGCLHKGIAVSLVMGIEISLSHCVSNHLRGRVTAVVFVALHLFHISKVFRSTERKKYVYKDTEFHSMSYLPGKLTCQHVLESPGRQYSRL